MAVGVLAAAIDAEGGGGDAGALDLFEGDGGAGAERVESGGDLGGAGAGVGEGGDEHVTGDSRECVEVADGGHELSLCRIGPGIVLR